MTEPSDAPQPRTVLYNRGCPIPRGEVIRAVREVYPRLLCGELGSVVECGDEHSSHHTD